MHNLYGLAQIKVWTIMALSVMGVLVSVQAQVANNDFYITRMGTALKVPKPGVLSNDTAVVGFSAALVTGPKNGKLAWNTNGSFTYTPTNSFTGVDGFTYVAKNGSLTSSVASVDIMVVASGENFYDNFARPAADGASFPWVTEVTPNVVGTWGITNQQLIGTGTITNYAYAYYQNAKWANYSVQAQFRFSANNAASAGILGRLNGTTGAHYAAWIYPEQSPEVFSPHDGTAVLWLIKYQNWTYPYTFMGSQVTLPGVGTDWHTVKMNFQGTSISVFYDGKLMEKVTDNGTIDGTAAYTLGGIGLNSWTLPPAAYAFSVDNVIVAANNNSLANYDAYQADKNTPLHVSAPGVLANDTGNGPLTATRVSNPKHGTLTLTNNGGFTYTPATNFTGVDHFTYRCKDGHTTSGTATVFITVSNAPLANNDAYTLPANTTLSVPGPGVLANDQGGNGTLTAILGTGPAGGTLTLASDGGFSYTPAANYSGIDSFTYLASDGHTTSSVATVTLTVSPAPIANNDFYSIALGTILNVPVPGVLANDSSSSSNFTAFLDGSPAQGSLLSWGGDGSFSYQAPTNYTGMDSFTYQAADNQGTSTVATVDIMILPSGDLFYDNFARPSGLSSIFPWVDQSGAWNVTNNLLSGISDFNGYGYAYTGDTNWTDYSVQAQLQFSDPNAWGGAVGGRLNPATGTHYAAWVYPEGSPWGPTNGAAGGVAYLQLIKYQNWLAYTAGNLMPLPGVGTNWHNLKLAFQGTAIAAYFDGNLVTNLVDDGSFDGQNAVTNGAISIDMWTQAPTVYTLSASNVIVTPLVLSGAYRASENTSLTVAAPGVLNGDTDIYGTNLTVALASGPTNGTVNLDTNGGFTYTPAANFIGTDGFMVQARDQLNLLGTARVTINILPLSAPPAPIITYIGLTNDTITINWLSVSGAVYRLQYNDNLGGTNWNDASTDVMATGPTTTQTNSLVGAAQRFYRVRLTGS